VGVLASDSMVRLVVDARSVELRRRVGANAWVVLEELLLGATVVVPGQAVSRATVRALAERTGLSKDTVARSLQRLRKANAFSVQPERHDDSGRFVSVRYLVDLRTLPIELVTVERAVVQEPIRPTRRTGIAAEQLSMLG
jgi:DNA-binding transcriptional regulator YhcF (GntR family)